MQQMPELMENGLDIPMREQGGLVADGRRHVPANAPGVGFEMAGRIDARQKGVHPRPAPFVFAGVPIGIKAAQKLAVFVADLVVLNVRMPHRSPELLYNFDAVEPLDDLEHARDYTLRGEIGAELFFIEIV